MDKEFDAGTINDTGEGRQEDNMEKDIVADRIDGTDNVEYKTEAAKESIDDGISDSESADIQDEVVQEAATKNIDMSDSIEVEENIKTDNQIYNDDTYNNSQADNQSTVSYGMQGGDTEEGVDTGKADADIEAQDIDDGALTENTDNKDKFRHTKKHKKKAVKTADNKTNNILHNITNPKSILYKLIAAFLVPVLCIIVLGVVSYNSAANALTSSYTESMKTAINKTSDYYNLMFSNVKATITDVINNPTMQEYYSGIYEGDSVNEGTIYQNLRSNISSTVMGNSAISNICIIGSYGKTISYSASKLQETGEYNNVKSSAEGKVIDSKRQSWFTSREYIDSAINSYNTISFGRQLIGTSKKSVGYIFADLDKSYLKKQLDEMELGVDNIIMIAAPDGGEIVSSNYIDIDTDKKYITEQEFYKQIAEGKDDNGSMYVKYEGRQQLFVYSRTDDNFIICTLVPKSEIVSKANEIGIITVIAVILAIIIAALIGTFLSRNIRSSIKSITGSLELASEGDFTVVIPIKGRDEFSRLAISTNSMIANVKELIEKTKGVSGKVDESTGIVNDSARNLLNDTKEITSAIEEIEKGIVQQAEESENCLRQIDELSDKINSVSQSSERIGQIAGETTDIVQSGVESIEALKENATDTIDITHTVIEQIVDLSDATKKIDKIINVINEIAEQTNLLSLNASIEAARAGESGRGFAVVASEIGKLAEQSVNSANEIRKIIGEINKKTDDTVNIAKKAEDVVDIQSKSLTHASGVFTDISSQFEELVANLDMISQEIINIADSKAETIDSIQSISAVSQQTAASSEEVTNTANRQLEAVEELNRISEVLQSNANDLSQAIDLFKI